MAYGLPTMTFNGTDVIVGQAVMKEQVEEADVPQGLKDELEKL